MPTKTPLKRGPKPDRPLARPYRDRVRMILALCEEDQVALSQVAKTDPALVSRVLNGKQSCSDTMRKRLARGIATVVTKTFEKDNAYHG